MSVRGSVTVFICIILSILIAFSGIMVDLSRLRTGEKHARAAVQLSVQSALAQYHAPLKENYGLMAMGYEQEELETLITDLLGKNLGVENRYMSGYTDLYGFEVKNVTVTPLFNLTEDYVLEQQITQFMKYRAPVSTIGNFIEKLKSLNTCMAQSGLVNKKMDLEKKLQKIREEQVYLRLLLTERMHGFSSYKKPGAELKRKFEAAQVHLDDIREMEATGGKLDTSWNAIPEYATKIAEAQGQISSLEGDISALKSDRNPLDDEYDELGEDIDSIENDIDDLNDDIQKLEKSISKEEGKKDPDEVAVASMRSEIEALQRSIDDHRQQLSSLETEQSDVSQEIEEIDDKIGSKNTEISGYQNAITKEMASLKAEVDSCLSVLSKISERAVYIDQQIQGTKAVVEKYIKYHEEALKLTDEIRRGCEQVQGLTSDIHTEITDQSKQSDNAFLTRMKADIQKLVLNADPKVLSAIQTDLEANLSSLQAMKAAVAVSETQMTGLLDDIENTIEKTEKILQNSNPFNREIFNTRLDETIKSLENQIGSSISGYKKPEYSIEPVYNKKEKSEFARWCNRVFGEDNETDISKDKGQQKQIKQNMKKEDKQKRDEQKTFNGSDEDMSNKELEELFSGLPSYKNKEGNYPNVVNSEANPGSEQENTILPETEEKENTDIEESYNNSLNMNGSFAKIIGEVLTNAGEAMIQSLYVNEFIVSVFKNANMNLDTGAKILLSGGPQETFYEKAEAEYVLFGCKKEKANANLAQVSIFGIRMGLNLLHVYTNSDKTATATTAAVTLAGWTGFAVPVVKNLILIGWAAGESWIDVKDINEGKDVPIYKTKNTWKLNLKSLFSGVADEVMKDSSEWLKQTGGDLIGDTDKALQSVVGDIISSTVHEAFLPLEEVIIEFGEEKDAFINPDVHGLQQPGEISGMEDVEAWITDMVRKQFEAIKDEGVAWTQVQLEESKNKITTEIQEFLFKSPAYKNFVAKIRGGLNDLIDTGANKLSDAVKKLGNEIKDTGTKEQLVGTVVSFDYVDYLRLLLFVVPQKTKLLRASDLMQLNMQKTLDNPDFMLSKYNSYAIVEADISMRYFFLPAFGQKDNGQIKIRWGYGY